MTNSLIVEETRVIATNLANKFKWRNIVFSKTGKSYRGMALHDTQVQAEERMLNVVGKARGVIPNSSPQYKGWKFQTMDGEFTGENYSWHMQLPEGL